jgi:hypothetical protein
VAPRFNRFAYASNFMRRKIVDHDDILALEDRHRGGSPRISVPVNSARGRLRCGSRISPTMHPDIEPDDPVKQRQLTEASQIFDALPIRGIAKASKENFGSAALPTALLPKGLIRPVSAIGKRYVMTAGMRFQCQTIAV